MSKENVKNICNTLRVKIIEYFNINDTDNTIEYKDNLQLNIEERIENIEGVFDLKAERKKVMENKSKQEEIILNNLDNLNKEMNIIHQNTIKQISNYSNEFNKLIEERIKLERISCNKKIKKNPKKKRIFEAEFEAARNEWEEKKFSVEIKEEEKTTITPNLSKKHEEKTTITHNLNKKHEEKIIQPPKEVKITISDSSKYMLSYNKHIINNIPTLEKWCGSKFGQVLYNSTINGNTNETFIRKIMNHSKLYFIIIDDNNNIFGHYHPSKIQEVNKENLGWRNYDKDIFIFTLYSNGRNGIEKYNNIGNDKLYTFIFTDKFYFMVGDSFSITPTFLSLPNGDIDRNITKRFSVKDKKIFTGGKTKYDGGIDFYWKEMIVVEMN